MKKYLKKAIKFIKENLLALGVAVLGFIITMFMGLPILKSLVIMIPTYTFTYAYFSIFNLKRDYKTSEKKFKNKSLSIITFVSLFLSILAFSFTYSMMLSTAIEAQEYLTYQYLNMVFTGLLNVSAVYNAKQSYVFITGKDIYFGEYIRLEDIIRVFYGYNKKGNKTAIQVTYKVFTSDKDFEAKDKFISYKEGLDDLLSNCISRSKFNK